MTRVRAILSISSVIMAAILKEQLVPIEWQPLFNVVLASIGAVLSYLASSKNPDGSDASLPYVKSKSPKGSART